MGSFIILDKPGRYNIARKGNGVLVNGFRFKKDVACNIDGPCDPPIILPLEVLELLGEEIAPGK